MTQITCTTLYKHLELLFNDSFHLCIYMTSSHILPPNAWKCYQVYFPSKPINSYHAMSSLVYYYTNILLFRCLLYTNNWECIRQAHINILPPACCCYCWMLLFLFICQKDFTIYVDESICCCFYCCCNYVTLFSFICNCGCTMTGEQQQ